MGDDPLIVALKRLIAAMLEGEGIVSSGPWPTGTFWVLGD